MNELRAIAAPRCRDASETLRREIETGRFATAEMLPGERDLAALLGISRTTLRRVIAGLIAQGVLTQRQGAGTFIRRGAPRVEQPLSRLTGFSQDMALRGLRAGSLVLESGLFLPTPEEAMMLGASPGEQVLRLSRLRLADDLPMAVEHAVVPRHFLPDPGAIGASLYAALAARGARPVRALQRLRAAILADEDADLLGVARGSPALHIQRLGYDAQGRCVEFTRSRYRADLYDFVAELSLPDVLRDAG